MKLNSNLFITASLAATLTLMAACAPAKKGTNFKDRSGAKSGMKLEDLFFKNKGNTDQDKEFAKTILFVGAIVEEASDSKFARSKLADKNGTKDTEKLSELVPLPESVDQTAGLTTNPPKDRREDSLISVRVVVDGIGGLDYMGYNDQFGSEKILVELDPAIGKCTEQKAGFLSVRAACMDKACAQLAVQIADDSGEKELIVNKVLNRVAQPTDGTIKVAQYKEVVSKVEATPESEEATDEVADKKKPAKPVMACKEEVAIVATAEGATDEASAATDSAKVVEDTKTEDSKPADEKAADAKDKSADAGLSAMDDV